MTLGAALVLVRFVHFAACLVSFGVSAVCMLSRRFVDERNVRVFRTVLLVSAALALVSVALWIPCTAGSMAGAWSSSLDPTVLKAVLLDTSFGHVWIGRAVAAIVLLLLTIHPMAACRSATLVAAAALLASVALSGHAAMQEGAAGIAHRGADALHLLAAGYWAGGLVGLLLLLRQRPTGDTFDILNRFSIVGVAAVVVIAASGITNAWFIVPEWRDLFASLYGRILLTKVSLFAAMVLVACINRFVLMPQLGRMDAAQELLRRTVITEIVLASLVVLVASLLGTVSPPAPM